MIPEPKGKEIVSLLERNITVMMYITIGTRNLQKYVSRTSVVFVSISFIVLMIISLAWLVFYYIQRFRYANARDRNQVSRARVTVCVSKKSPGIQRRSKRNCQCIVKSENQKKTQESEKNWNIKITVSGKSQDFCQCRWDSRKKKKLIVYVYYGFFFLMQNTQKIES